MVGEMTADGRRDDSPLMVGREAERARLRALLAGSMEGNGQLVLIGGEAGIGKTTLARDLARTATTLGATVLTGACYDLTATPPYGPWRDLAERAPRSGPSPPSALADGSLEGVAGQAAIYAQALGYLDALAARQPLLVLLEDLHWADPASLDLLRFVGNRLAGRPILLVVTYRLDEMTRQTPLYRQLPTLVRECDGLRIDLRRLGADDIGALADARYALISPDRDRLVTYLIDHAEGNPFFAVELLRALEGLYPPVLRRADGDWRLGALDRVVVPTLVQQVIDFRFERLGAGIREPLTIASVIGQRVPLALWGEVAGLSEEDLLPIVDEAVAAHLLAALPDGAHVRFVHALTREALHERILSPRRRRLHRVVAEALAARPGADPDTIAGHFQRSGDPRAVDWLERAGDRAQRTYAWDTAHERFVAAAALLEGTPGAESRRGRLLFRAARLRRWADPAGCIAMLDKSARLAEVSGDAFLQVECDHARGQARCFLDDWSAGLAGMIAAAEALEAMPPEMMREGWSSPAWLVDALPAIPESGACDAADRLATLKISHRRGMVASALADTGRLAVARVEAGRVLDALAGVGPSPIVLANLGDAHIGMATVEAFEGYPDRAREHLRQARAALYRLGHHGPVGDSYYEEFWFVNLPYRTDDVAERRRLGEESDAVMGRIGGAMPYPDWTGEAYLGRFFVDGRWTEARSIVRGPASWENVFIKAPPINALAPILLHQGRHADAWEVVRREFPDGPATEPGGKLLHLALQLQRIAAALSRATGDLAAARAWLAANNRWLDWSGSTWGRSENHLDWAELLRADDDLAGAMERAERAVEAATAPRQPLALLQARRLRGELLLASGERAAIQDLDAALALAERCELPYEVALAQVARAEAHLAEGKPEAANSLLDLAEAVFIRLEAAPALARLAMLRERLAPAAPPVPGGLTPREIEVLGLVAQGLTDAEIGKQLFISAATASKHLRAIYGKLDLHTRAAVTRFAMQHGLD